MNFLNTVYRIPDAGAGGGSTPPTPTPDDGNGAGDEQTYTQKDLDAVAAKERKRGVTKGANDLLAELGFEKPEDLQKSLKELGDLKKSQLSEQEKQQAELTKAKEDLQKAQAERDKALETASRQLMKAAVLIAASEQFTDPNDAWHFIDHSQITTNEDGEFEGIEAAVKAVAESKPYLLKSAPNGKAPGTPTRKRFAPPKQPDTPQQPEVTINF